MTTGEKLPRRVNTQTNHAFHSSLLLKICDKAKGFVYLPDVQVIKVIVRNNGKEDKEEECPPQLV